MIHRFPPALSLAFLAVDCGPAVDAADGVSATTGGDTARTVSVPAGPYLDLRTGEVVSSGSRTLPPRSLLVVGER